MEGKRVLLFISGMILGAAAGGGVAWYVTKRYYEKENMEAANERAEYYHKKYNDIPLKKEEPTDESSNKEKGDDEVETEETSYEKVSGIYRPEESDRVVVDYKSIGSSSDNNPQSSQKKKGRKKKPYLISEEIWNENEIDYDKRFISYHEADGVLVDDETDSPVDIMNEIGEFNLNDTEDLDEAIYIANDQIRMMYMVTVEHDAFNELV